jgi:putative transposase
MAPSPFLTVSVLRTFGKKYYGIPISGASPNGLVQKIISMNFLVRVLSTLFKKFIEIILVYLRSKTIMGRQPIYIKLSEQEDLHLTEMLTKGIHSARVLKRARILQLNHQGKTLREIRDLLTINYVSVSGIVKDYREGGLEYALYDLPRSGAPVKITQEIEAHTTAIACSEAPDGRVNWTIELIRDELVRLKMVDSLSKTSTHTILKKVNLNLGNKNFGVLKK